MTSSIDSDYEAFLKKSQTDYSAGFFAVSNGVGDMKMSAIKVDMEPHAAIRDLGERFYVSDVDECFKGVSFDWKEGDLPNADEFTDLTGIEKYNNVETMKPAEWDPKGIYNDVVNAVKTACNGGAVMVYVVHLSVSRITYFVIGLNELARKAVGVRVLAVES